MTNLPYDMTAKKLLVADDSVTIQKVIRLALSNEGYEIQAVSDGTDAIQQISVFRPDIVLVDVSLPGKNAFELKRAVNQHPDLRAVRFILMSSAFERVDEAQAAEVEFHARLTKPFDPAHLREILTQVIATQQNYAPEAPMQAPSEMEAEFITPSRSEDSSSEDDIRQLTESTIRISGLDHFQNSEQPEPMPFAAPVGTPMGAPMAPTIPPPQPEPISASTELRNSLLYQEGLAIRESASQSHTPPPPQPSQPADDLGWSVQEPVLKPPRTIRRESLDTTFPVEELARENENPYGSSRSTPKAPPPGFPPPFPPPGFKPSNYEMPSYETPAYEAPSYEPPKYEAPRYEPPTFTPPPAEATGLSESDIERLVAEKVTEKIEDALRKLTQAVLPDVVERIVKEEIHRLLSEQP